MLSRYILYGLQHLLSGGMEDRKLHLSLDAREMGTTLGAWQLAHKKMVLETHWRLRQSGIESAFWVCQSKWWKDKPAYCLTLFDRWAFGFKVSPWICHLKERVFVTAIQIHIPYGAMTCALRRLAGDRTHMLRWITTNLVIVHLPVRTFSELPARLQLQNRRSNSTNIRIPRLSKAHFQKGCVISTLKMLYHVQVMRTMDTWLWWNGMAACLLVDVLWLLQLLDAHGRYIWTSWLLQILAHLFVYCMLSQQCRSVATMQRVNASLDFCMMALLKSQTKMLKFWFWLTFLMRVMRRKLLMQWDPGVVLLNPYCS